MVANSYIQNTGDDVLALWGGELLPGNVTFRDCVAVNPGILRPNWYGTRVPPMAMTPVQLPQSSPGDLSHRARLNAAGDHPWPADDSPMTRW